MDHSVAVMRPFRASPSRCVFPRNLILLLLGLLAVPGCDALGGDEADGGATQVAIPVQAEPVVRGNLTNILRRTGEVRAQVEVRVFSQVPDRILDLRVEEGDRVVRDQVIAIIQSNALAAGVAQAAASLESARVQRDKVRDDLERAERLLASNVASQAQVDSLRRGLAAADAQVRALQAAVEQVSTHQAQSLVRAPISGLVGTRHLSRGDLAVPQLPIVTLVQIDRVKVLLQATELDLPHLGVGTPVEIRVAAHPGEIFRGAVNRVGNVLDPLSRHAPVEILLDNPGHRLKPGMLAEVAVVLEQREQVVVAPFFALTPVETHTPSARATDTRYQLYVVEEGVARRRLARIGLLEQDRVEVVEGLAPGDLLVVRGQQLLDDGSHVEVIAAEPSAATRPTTPTAGSAAPGPSSAVIPPSAATTPPGTAPLRPTGAPPPTGTSRPEPSP